MAWGLTCDYFWSDGHHQFIECNPRTVEPGNAAAAGVNLPVLTIALANGHPVPTTRLIGKPGVRTHSTMALALGAAEKRGTRRAVLKAVAGPVSHRGMFRGSREVLTPIGPDLPSLLPALVATGSVLIDPSSVTRLAGGAVDTYSITPETISRLR